MVNKQLIWVIGLCLSFVVQAQDTTYYDYEKRVLPNKENAEYYRILTKEDSIWKVERFYSATHHLEMQGYYTDPKKATREDTFTWYFENGNKKEETTYHHNVEKGTARAYYKNGNLKWEKLIRPVTSSRMLQAWTPEGEAVLTKGNGTFRYYDSTKERFITTTYKDSIGIDSYVTDESGKILDTLPKITEAAPKGGKMALAKYLSSNLRYPDISRKMGVEGTVYVAFKTLKDGSISNVWVIKGLDPACNAEAIRIVQQMPVWEPATFLSEPLETKQLLPIVFKLK
ncbi:energy transducer TonB [Aquimarina brevivitae]|nr:energy transducer TonB [Aquimarina brevivitae]